VAQPKPEQEVQGPPAKERAVVKQNQEQTVLLQWAVAVQGFKEQTGSPVSQQQQLGALAYHRTLRGVL
jgi:hypothetical protein